MKTSYVLSGMLVLSLLAGLPAHAKDKHHGHSRDEEESAAAPGRTEQRREGDKRFSDEERHAISFYVEHYGRQEGKHSRSLPPGLAKKVARGGQLPPGWQQQCQPGQTMPPEVYQEARPLPRELQVSLPVPPVGTVTVAVGGKVVRLIEATREILDVFDVLNH